MRERSVLVVRDSWARYLCFLATALVITFLSTLGNAATTASALLTVAVGEVRVSGAVARAPLALSEGKALVVPERGKAVIYVPASGIEYTIGPGGAQLQGDAIVPATNNGSVIQQKQRNALFKTTRLTGGVLLQAGGQFKFGGGQASPEQQIVLPRYVEFSWPVTDRNGPFRFRLFSPTGELVITQIAELTRLTLESIPTPVPGGDYRWEVAWQDAQKRDQTLSASFRLDSVAAIANAEALFASVQDDADGRALYAAWVTTQRRQIAAQGERN